MVNHNQPRNQESHRVDLILFQPRESHYPSRAQRFPWHEAVGVVTTLQKIGGWFVPTVVITAIKSRQPRGLIGWTQSDLAAGQGFRKA